MINIKSMIGRKCTKRHTIQVCRSNAGYYIGTLDEDNMPYCRLTNYDSNSNCNVCCEIQNPENDFCNGGRGCF